MDDEKDDKRRSCVAVVEELQAHSALARLAPAQLIT